MARMKSGRTRRLDWLKIAQDYCLRGLTANQVAKLHGCNPRTVRQIVKDVSEGRTPDASESLRRLCGQDV